MINGHEQADKSADTVVPARRDRGMTFVEVLVAIVLLGTAITATLAALRTTVISTAVERDHARAYQWLQDAVGAIRETDYVPCDDAGTFGTAQAHMLNDYSGAVAADTTPPAGWSATQIVVLSPIEVWNGDAYLSPVEASDPDPCYKAEGFSLQLVTVEVRDTDGDIVETVQVVKDDN